MLLELGFLDATDRANALQRISQFSLDCIAKFDENSAFNVGRITSAGFTSAEAIAFIVYCKDLKSMYQ